MYATPRAWEENTERAAHWIGAAAAGGADLILLPELFAIGSFFGPDLPTFAEPPMARTTQWLRGVAQEHGATVAGTILERWGLRIYNTLLVADSSGRLFRYMKRHLSALESKIVASGRTPNVLPATIGRIGCLICSDGNNVELRQSIARAKVDLILVPQAIGATMELGRRVEAMEKAGSCPLWGPIVRELGAPAVLAGLLGVFENPTPEDVGDYLRGGTYVIDASGHALAHVAFPEEGVALATVTLRHQGD
jgi:predicted amidohydrolase